MIEKKELILGKVGIVDGGIYNPTTTYNSMTFVLYNGSTWLAIKDNLTGVIPEEGENWKYLARGFEAELLALITAIDSQGLLGNKGGEVTGQALIDKLADMVVNKLIQKTSMSNIQVNDQDKIPTSALAYAMQQSITNNETAITQLNRDMEYKSVSVEKNADCVADSYSLGFKKSGICVLTLDVYT
ncbi:MAG: hypothetical protein ACOX8K_10000, partial [Lachnospiraceae bacterium]